MCFAGSVLKRLRGQEMAVNKKLTRERMIEILNKARARYPDGSYVYDDSEILALLEEEAKK